MGGFFLVCTRPNEDREDAVCSLKRAFAELGFAPPEIIKSDEYFFAAYPKFQSKSAALKRFPNGDFGFVCGTCLCEGEGLADVASLYEGATARSPQSACEYVFNGVVSGNETLFNEVKVAPIHATIVAGPHALEIIRPPLRVT